MVQPAAEKQLAIAEYHRSASNARLYAEGLATDLGVPPPRRADYASDVRLQWGQKILVINFAGSVEEARREGIPKLLQQLFDARDTFLAPALEIGVGPLPPGLSMQVTSSVGSFSRSIPAPGWFEAPELSLTRDILTFRRLACEYSDPGSFSDAARFYRSYLQSCVSLVDCFLFRYTSFVRDKIGDLEKYANTRELGSPIGIERRIEAWMTTFATHRLSDYKGTGEWSQFQELRRERNRIVHPVDPAVAYQPKQMARYLNFCRRGIGGLLSNLRKYSAVDDRVGFIQQLVTAPEIRKV